MLNPLLSPGLREAVAEVVRSTEPFLDDLVARYGSTNKGRIFAALYDVKQSHGRARREALRKLDALVTELFPPVEGAPLPSVELNGKADVLPNALVIPEPLNGATATYYCGPVSPYRGIYSNPFAILPKL